MQIYGGGWDTELSGIWVGKYESARSDAEGTNPGTSTKIKVQPNVASWRSITIGDAYTNSLNYSQDLKSHMLKNSEWGAVAYLTHSKYGRNETKVTINDNTSYLTANGDIQTNVNQSSTGNVYGVYDLVGGANEYTAAYYNGSGKLTKGSAFASQNGISDVYSTAYTGVTASTAYKYGDATNETYEWDNSGWNSFPSADNPFFGHGGKSGDGTHAGIFYYNLRARTRRRSYWFSYKSCDRVMKKYMFYVGIKFPTFYFYGFFINSYC